MTAVNIIGAYHSKFGKLEEESLYSLYEKAIKGVLEEARLGAEDIDAVFVGNFSGGTFNNQENIACYGVNALPALRHKPMYRTENACASGSSAVHMAAMAIQSGMIKRAVVIGLEKMTSLETAGVSRSLALATYWPEEGAQNVTAPCMFAQLARGWMKKYGYSEDKLRPWLAEVAAKNYAHAAQNPLAHLQKPRSKAEILDLPDEKNPVIDAPLRLHDCSLISDGASALVLQANNLGSNGSQPVALTGFYNASDYLDNFGKKKSDSFLEGASVAVKMALRQSGMSIDDMQLAEVHDCFTITELLLYSAMGLAAPGKEFEALESKQVFANGRCVINPSGGLKAKGHPIGATGVSMHASVYRQLIGDAYGLQVPDAEAGMVVNIGGSGTSNCVSVLKRV
ncbi:3-ketoacyl-CoA thiolase [Fulvivirga imtechensis AK7]|uniref:3-ketoacyl-CoA thiolase n=1 Tax=Fulvivirga imtechensis AK7 TaxID=1237149 RepID=L8JZC2_9BACT|nr:beta-ketoacyl synthase N-terminal-like domain-containing protein [Fulvivirga imtechensis]ELR73508.1 3-ketoacyl-CoA thiolase [Fulvivirga imtechensis AK7]